MGKVRVRSESCELNNNNNNNSVYFLSDRGTIYNTIIHL